MNTTFHSFCPVHATYAHLIFNLLRSAQSVWNLRLVAAVKAWYSSAIDTDAHNQST